MVSLTCSWTSASVNLDCLTNFLNSASLEKLCFLIWASSESMSS